MVGAGYMFDELKIKSLLKKKLTEDKYKSLSLKIQNDSRVIAHLIKCDPKSIAILGESVDISSFVLDNYDLIKYLNPGQLDMVFDRLDLSKIDINADFFNKLYSDKRDIVFRRFPSICINFYENSKRRELIGEIISAKAKNDKFSKLYNAFSDDELKNLILNLDSKDLIYLLIGKSIVKEYVVGVISSLDEEVLMGLYKKCNDVYEYFSKEMKQMVDIKNCGGNLSKILELDVETQVKFFIANPHLLRCAPESVVRKYVDSVDKLSCNQFILNGNKVYKTDIYKFSEEELIEFLSSNFTWMFWYCNFKDDDIDYLQKFVFRMLEKLDDFEKQNQLKELYKSLSNKRINPSEPFIYFQENYQISKLLFDEKVIRNNSVELLQKYKDTLDRDILIEILSNAYGEHVREIFADRPNLNLLDIDNLSILAKNIYDVLGKGFVDYALTYNLGFSNYLIYQFANDLELLHSFSKYFSVMTADMEDLGINVISNLIDKFMIHKDIFREIDFDNLSDERKKRISLLINDIDMVTVYVQSLEDLDNYIEIRNKRFMEIIDSLDEPYELKNIIFAYVTGREIIDKSEEYTLENLTFDLIVKTFDIMNIVQNEELIKKMNLNKDDVAILLLLHEIEQIRDVEVLKNTFKALVNRELDSKLLASTFDKIKDYYVNDIKSNLLSGDSLDKMDKIVVDGVEVVNFEGEPFSLIMSVTGVNLSGSDMSRAVFGQTLLDDWLHREGGLTTISTALCSSDTSIYPIPLLMWEELNKHISFVFDTNVDIAGMGGSDISSSHDDKSRKHAFNYIMYNDFGFSTMDDLKRRINKRSKEVEGLTKFSSEITIARFEEDIRRDDSGKRVMPIGLYVIGEITPEVLETAKIFNQYYEKNGLGKFRIIRVNPKVYKGEGRIVCDNSNGKGDDSYGKNI